MPELNARQERFCRAFAEVAGAGYAARIAGYAPLTARQQGHRLLKDPRITRRIADIQAAMARDSCRATDVLLGKLETIYRQALESHNFPAAARAVEIQARLSVKLAAASAGEEGKDRESAAGAEHMLTNVDEC